MGAYPQLFNRGIRVAIAWPVLAIGCQQTGTTPPGDAAQGEVTMRISINSAAFSHNEPIPRKHTGEGADVSPPLSWARVPDGARELALIMDDPDAPRAEPWVHWVIYKLPPALTGLPEAVPKTPTLTDPAGALQGNNTWPKIGYYGPMPPPGHGVHHYHFKLYALDTTLDVQPGLDKDGLLAKMKGHILAEGELIGTYER